MAVGMANIYLPQRYIAVRDLGYQVGHLGTSVRMTAARSATSAPVDFRNDFDVLVRGPCEFCCKSIRLKCGNDTGPS